MTRPSHEVKTITDVAKAAGVSRATVSRALNGSTAVSEDTRSHVQAVAKRLGYTINAQAQALATGRSNTIAILITEPIDELFDDPTFAVLIRGISEELCRRSFLPMILQASTPEEQRLALRHLESKAIDAVIDISPYTRSDLLRGLTKQPSPVVLCGQLERNPYEGVFSSVYSDDYEGGRIAGEAMARRGRRKVAIEIGRAHV